MKKPYLMIGGWLLVLGLGVGYWSRSQAKPRELARLWPAPDVSVFAVTTENANNMRLAELKGSPWVANFIFTRCGGPCPIMSGKMAALQRVLPAEIKLVSFTVDPDYDNAAVLKEYAERFKANPDRWLFARTSKEALFKIANEGFKLAIAENRQEPPETRVLHSTKFVLVDADGMVRAFYDTNSESIIPNIERDVQLLLKQPA